jgi:hypothetical protein
MVPVVLAVALAAAAPLPCAPGFSLETALSRSLAVDGARLFLLDVRAPKLPPGCLVDSVEVERRITGSGQVAVRLSGRRDGGLSCQGWAWARVKVVASVRVAARALRTGESLAGATVLEEREINSSYEPLDAIADDATTTRPLAAGQVLQRSHVRLDEPAPGQPVTVVAQAGAVSIVQTGRVVPCVRGRGCAQLPSGRRVEGRFSDGRLLVEVP